MHRKAPTILAAEGSPLRKLALVAEKRAVERTVTQGWAGQLPWWVLESQTAWDCRACAHSPPAHPVCPPCRALQVVEGIAKVGTPICVPSRVRKGTRLV